MTATLDVIAIGNAIVDVLAHTEDAFIEKHDLIRGAFVLIDEEKAAAIGADLHNPEQVAGGSAGNTVACLASLGGKAAYIGKVADDEFGAVYRNSMEEIGVKFLSDYERSGAATGRCLIAVTPDAERTMATLLGAAGMITVDDIDEEDITQAAVTYFEGYQFDAPHARQAFMKACMIAHKAGRKTSLTLSDIGVVERNREVLLEVINDHVDLVFANEDEARALFGTHDNAQALAAEMSKIVPFGAVTCSERGSIVYGPEHPCEEVPAFTPPQLVDTTGAGDAYAGGFLYCFTRNMPLDECARLGSLCASEVISHMGPRPEVNLAELAKEKGFF
ncbi:adenosine kinase [Parvularcula marina]|uniref:adenosine kinase n=1 Tax=Parvularcula marina TaxID=2292771 RepID=UPI003513E12B